MAKPPTSVGEPASAIERSDPEIARLIREEGAWRVAVLP